MENDDTASALRATQAGEGAAVGPQAVRKGLPPDFLIAGAHKCATTSIHDLLAQHPGVAMSSPKEPHYLARRALRERMHAGVWDADTYNGLWEGVDESQIRGESSVHYIDFAGEVLDTLHVERRSADRVVICLRDPVERAFSSYQHERLTNPAETAPTFGDAVEREMARGPARIDGAGTPALRHLAIGFYSPGVETFLEAFGRERVLAVVFEQFVASPESVMSAVHRFLELPDIAYADLHARNAGGVRWRDGLAARFARSRSAVWTRRLAKRVAPGLHARLTSAALHRLTVSVDPMTSHVRRTLNDLYRSDVKRTSDLLDLDLSHWLKDPGQ